MKKSKKRYRIPGSQYEGHIATPRIVRGIQVRSRLEAEWLEELIDCDHFKCVECVQVPVWIEGPYGRFLRNYKPDLAVDNVDGQILIELKPTVKLALEDTRQKRALELNPRFKFIVIGGYPNRKNGVLVRLLTGNQEKVYDGVSTCEVLQFLGCECRKLKL